MKSPTEKALKYLRSHGWNVAVTEHWNSFAGVRKVIPVKVCPRDPKCEVVQPFGIRQDLFFFIDLLALRDDETLAIQTTSKAGMRDRFRKITGILSDADREDIDKVTRSNQIRENVMSCFDAGWRIHVWGFVKGSTDPIVQVIVPGDLAAPPEQMAAF